MKHKIIFFFENGEANEDELKVYNALKNAFLENKKVTICGRNASLVEVTELCDVAVGAVPSVYEKLKLPSIEEFLQSLNLPVVVDVAVEPKALLLLKTGKNKKGEKMQPSIENWP